MITFEFNIFPISVNKLYSTRFGQRRRFLTTEGRKFKEVINKEVTLKLQDSAMHTIVSSLINKPLEVHIQVYSSTWLLKDKKTIRIKDIANQEKALLDSLFTAFKEASIDIDDSQIWKLVLTKHVNEEEKTIVTMGKFEGTL